MPYKLTAADKKVVADDNTLPKPLDIRRLRRNLTTIMAEIDKMEGTLPDYYSPVTWQRFQTQTDIVATAIDAVRLRLSGLNAGEVARMVGTSPHTVAGYNAWNTMYDPKWVAPSAIVATIPCQCGAVVGVYCRVDANGNRRICKSRREAYKADNPERVA